MLDAHRNNGRRPDSVSIRARFFLRQGINFLAHVGDFFLTVYVESQTPSEDDGTDGNKTFKTYEHDSYTCAVTIKKKKTENNWTWLRVSVRSGDTH